MKTTFQSAKELSVNHSRTANSEYFEPGMPPVFVTGNKHHGKVSLHSHEFFELVFIERGVALHSHEGNTQILTTGDVFIILPGEVHSYISANNTSLYNCLFTAAAMAGQEQEIDAMQGLSWLLHGRTGFQRVHAGLAETQELLLLLEKMTWERLNRTVGWELKLKSLFYGLLVAYARLYSNSALSGDGASANFMHVFEAVAYIEANYRNDVPLEEVAKAAGLSMGYLSKQFKNLLGSTPAEYARNFRMAKAAELLRNEANSVAHVSEILGFSDISLFSRQFRQVTGISPTGFRKNE
jgi:AraC-like DNA-binding protein/mannose-6-phosphate isomerase-like protein (cupin superfamily)